ncbi:MAG: alpha/beta hydrolase fold domain-containing protein [Planctomycetes bacterium]|nr:alpha/beta hydrolase fold domain-containing protein [Planctomycetota bacterium]
MKRLSTVTSCLFASGVFASMSFGQTSSVADTKLPRVLLIGDSISIGYTKAVRRLLAGRAIVEHNAGNAAHTRNGAEKLDAWLAANGGNWDVIHFNFGLHDLAYRNFAPGSNEGRGLNKATGKQTHTLDEYATNLAKIIARLEKTDAALIFATTTPVPEGEPGRVVADVPKYNAVATKLMRASGIAIDDLFTLMDGRLGEFATKPGNVHFTPAGSELLAAQVVKSIDRALAQRSNAKSTRWSTPKRIVYKRFGASDADRNELALHVFEPDHHATTDHRAAIVFFFGGGWNGGSPQQFYPQCDYLASRGMVAISAEYRVKNRHGTTPFECVKDGKAVIRYVRDRADDLGIDPNRIAASGGSAGGHVAAALATVEGIGETAGMTSSKPDALVLFNPVYDNGPGGYGYERVRDRFREISPLHNIRRGMPPTLVFFGTEDSLVPFATAKKFQAAMRAVDARSELELYEGAKHGFFNYGRGDGEAYRSTVRRMDEFLASLGFLDGAPTLRRSKTATQRQR